MYRIAAARSGGGVGGGGKIYRENQEVEREGVEVVYEIRVRKGVRKVLLMKMFSLGVRKLIISVRLDRY